MQRVLTSMPTVREGFLYKQPVSGHIWSHTRRRYFVLTSEPHRLEWYKDERKQSQPNWLPVQPVANISRSEQGLVLVSSRKGRPATLILRGTPTELDEWESALRIARETAPITKDGSDGSFQSYGSESSSFKSQGKGASSVLDQPFPDAPPMPQHASLTVGQRVATGSLRLSAGDIQPSVTSTVSALQHGLGTAAAAAAPAPNYSPAAAVATPERRHAAPPKLDRPVFFSYRVSTDAELVERMHDKLRSQGVGVWWDKACLAPGLQWEQGFADGLFGAYVFVPFLSKAALAPFAKLQPGSGCDNVLLEFRLALELVARGELHRVFPVFLGEPEDYASLGEGYGDFFQGGGMPMAPDVRVEAVEAKR